MSSLRPLYRQAATHFDERFILKQSESFLSQPEHAIWVSRQRTLKTQYLYLGVFLWKQNKILVSYKDFCKLQFFFMYSFTHTNIVLFFQVPTYWNCHLQKRLLLDEVFQWWWLFLFSEAGFANISPTFLISC